MRPSAKHMLLVSTLIPAFLLLGCDNAVTGLDDNRDPPRVTDAGEGVSGQSVAAEPPQDEFCFEYKGEWVCPSEEDPRIAK